MTPTECPKSRFCFALVPLNTRRRADDDHVDSLMT